MKVVSSERVRRRLVDELSGLSSGLLADGHLSDSEIFFLMNWMDKNQELMTDWPFDKLVGLLNQAVIRGEVIEAKRSELIAFLTELSNAVFTDSEERLSSILPLCNPVPCVQTGNFVFTGKFEKGSRAKCTDLTTAKGAVVQPRVRKDTNFVVIGSFVSEDWKHSTYGSKIERAVELRDSGTGVSIISEEVWLHWLESGVDGEKLS